MTSNPREARPDDARDWPHEFRPMEAHTAFGVRTRLYCPRCGVSRPDTASQPAGPCRALDSKEKDRG